MVRKNDLIMQVTEQTELEKLKNSEDRWPFLNFRKTLKRIKIYITMGAGIIIKHPAFETTSIIIICLNCVTLAMEDPTSKEVSQFDFVAEWTFQLLYTIEMCIKIVGMGFIFGKGAYLRDPWNILDFVIVMSAWLTIAQDELGP